MNSMNEKFNAKNDPNFDAQMIMCSTAITYKYDLLSACLYGLIWSKCHLEKGYCCASQTTLGKELKCSRKRLETGLGF